MYSKRIQPTVSPSPVALSGLFELFLRESTADYSAGREVL